MLFFKQTEPKTCDIVAIEDVFSFLHEYHSAAEIQKRLRRYSFGSWLPDIGTYFEKAGVRTKLISNCEKFSSPNAEFEKELEKYEKLGTFEERIPVEADIKNNPIIVNVDAFKIRGQKGGPGAHYVVVLKEKDDLFMYDGLDYDRKVKVDFETLYGYSLNVSKFLPNGMWLLIG